MQLTQNKPVMRIKGEMPLDRSEMLQDRLEAKVKAFDQVASENQSGLAETSANDNSLSLEETFRRYYKNLIRVGFAVTRRAEDSADAVSSAIQRGMELEHKPQDWLKWLVSTTRNAAIDIVRKRKGTVPVSVVDAELALTSLAGEFDGGMTDLLVAELRQKASKHKGDLDFFDDLLGAVVKAQTKVDIAEIMGISRLELYRGLDRLRALLGVVPFRRIRRTATKRATGLTIAGLNRYGTASVLCFAPLRDKAHQNAFDAFYTLLEGEEGNV